MERIQVRDEGTPSGFERQFEIVNVHKDEIPGASPEFRKFLTQVNGVAALNPVAERSLVRQLRAHYGTRR
jgi:hypothetical protein